MKEFTVRVEAYATRKHNVCMKKAKELWAKYIRRCSSMVDWRFDKRVAFDITAESQEDADVKAILSGFNLFKD